MNRNVEISILYEIYKPLLTDRMREIFEDYHYLDLSLREIGENRKISYQAVRDSVKKTENTIIDYEQKLKINKLRKRINKAKAMIENGNKEEIIKILEDLGEN